MKRPRVRLVVEVDLDPVSGFNHEPQDFADHLRYRLEQEVPWYSPSVSPAELIDRGQA